MNELKYLQLKETKVRFPDLCLWKWDINGELDSVRCRDRRTGGYDLIDVWIQGTSVLVAGHRIFGNLHCDLYDCQLLGAALLGD